MADPGLACEMAQLPTTCARCGPVSTVGPVEHARGRRAAGLRRRRRGGRRARRPRGAEQPLGQGYPGPPSTTSTWRRSSSTWGRGRRRLRGAAELERELERQGYLQRGDGGLELTPRAVRRLGETALDGCSRSSTRPARGDHDDHRRRLGRRADRHDAAVGVRRRAALDAVRTVSNAAAARRPGTAGAARVEDFEVVETERRTAAAVALWSTCRTRWCCAGRWGADEVRPRWRCTHLVDDPVPAGRPRDHRLRPDGPAAHPVQLADVEPDCVQGTNLQHALMLAAAAPAPAPGRRAGRAGGHRRRADRPPAPRRQRRLPLAADAGDAARDGRPGRRADPARRGDQLLHARRRPGPAAFVDAIARRAGGRVFTPDLSRLGEYVVADYLTARRGRR